jgi:hypothetical protein
MEPETLDASLAVDRQRSTSSHSSAHFIRFAVRFAFTAGTVAKRHVPY